MGQINLGIKKIEFATIPQDGDYPSGGWTNLGYTVEDSTTLTMEDGNTTEYMVEELDVPLDTTTSGGRMYVTFTIADPTAETLVAVMGGKVDQVSGNYISPDKKETIEKAMRITPMKGMGFLAARVGIKARFTTNMGKNNYLGVEVEAEFKKPIKSGVPVFETFTEQPEESFVVSIPDTANSDETVQVTVTSSINGLLQASLFTVESANDNIESQANDGTDKDVTVKSVVITGADTWTVKNSSDNTVLGSGSITITDE